MWTEDDTKWEPLRLALMSGAEGSRILVTTRNEAVARMMGATTQIIHLEKLSDEHCFSLFYHLAFLNREKEKSDLFEGIGQKIVKKCKGSPLAAKTLGSLMWNKKTLKEWSDVLNSEIWDLEVVEQKVFQPLLLSYHDLASEIKRSLLFCACFPQDHRFYKDTLIELWMSQNYLNSKRNKERRTIGQNYFDDLVARSFFQDFELDDKGNIETCMMHDIVHEFVKFLAGNESLIIDLADGANRAIELSSDKVCHLSLVSARGWLSVPISFHKCTNLRTLTTFASKKRNTTIDGDLVLQLKCLRTLKLSDWVEEVPKEIGELFHLRYIDLSGYQSLKELPDAICNLFNLETLHLENCALEKLPKAMGKLINLKHLYVRGCKIKYLPKGIGRIRGLCKLDEYKVVCGEHGDNGNEILELGDLGMFDQLQGKIVIRKLGKAIDAREAQKAQLEKKKHLLILELNFGKKRSDGEEEVERRRKSDVEILNALQPHENLEYLRIVSYRGTTVSPKWLMSLHHLRYLTLVFCIECECLPPLGRLPSLEVLKIYGTNVKKVGIEFLGIEETRTSPVTAFPKLEKLFFERTQGWKEWEGVRGYKGRLSFQRVDDRSANIVQQPLLPVVSLT
ncbi:hypothetical protein ACLB2K_055337 [Fragaria x ananassa]